MAEHVYPLMYTCKVCHLPYSTAVHYQSNTQRARVNRDSSKGVSCNFCLAARAAGVATAQAARKHARIIHLQHLRECTQAKFDCDVCSGYNAANGYPVADE